MYFTGTENRYPAGQSVRSEREGGMQRLGRRLKSPVKIRLFLFLVLMNQLRRAALFEGRPDNARLSLTARSIWGLLRMREVRSPGTVNLNSSVSGIRDIRYHCPFNKSQFILYLDHYTVSLTDPQIPMITAFPANANYRCGKLWHSS